MSFLLSLLAASSGNSQATDPAPSPKPTGPLTLGPGVHVHVDANSLFAKWIAPGIQEVGQLGAMLKASGASSSNTAIPGQSWAEMRLASSDVEASYVPGKTNVLIVGESTNQAFNGAQVANAQEVLREARRYLVARRAAHPDYVILGVGTIPRADRATAEENRQANQVLLEVDRAMSQNLGEYELDGWVDVRAFAPQWFKLREDGMTAPFMDSLETCNSYNRKDPDMVHPIGAPRTAFADAIAQGLARLRVSR